MAELDLRVAINIAGGLVTIGHPFTQQSLNATAMDLVNWCKGCVLAGVVLSPAQQAQMLVDAARTTWSGWFEGGGTQGLLALFRSMFERKPEPSLIEQRQDMERQFGPADKNWSSKMLKAAATGDKHKDFLNQSRKALLHSIADSIYYTEGKGSLEIEGSTPEKRFSQGFWHGAMNHHMSKHPEEVAMVRSGQWKPEESQ